MPFSINSFPSLVSTGNTVESSEDSDTYIPPPTRDQNIERSRNNFKLLCIIVFAGLSLWIIFVSVFDPFKTKGDVSVPKFHRRMPP